MIASGYFSRTFVVASTGLFVSGAGAIVAALQRSLSFTCKVEQK